MTPTDLLAKLEEAECGSRELDFLCWWYGQSTESVKANPQPPDADYMAAALASPHGLPAYTRSVDAALSLVPEGWRIAHAEDLLLGAWDVEVREINSASGHSGGAWVYRNHPARAATFPIAICSAALRARAVMGGGK